MWCFCCPNHTELAFTRRSTVQPQHPYPGRWTKQPTFSNSCFSTQVLRHQTLACHPKLIGAGQLLVCSTENSAPFLCVYLFFLTKYTEILLQGSAGACYARFLPSQVAGLGPGTQDDGDACEPRFGVSKTPRP